MSNTQECISIILSQAIAIQQNRLCYQIEAISLSKPQCCVLHMTVEMQTC